MPMRGRPLMAAAFTASAVSSARTNRAVRKNIEGQNAAQQQQAPAAAPVDTGAQAPTLEQELEQLKSMLDKGLITQEEYDAKKKEVLGL